MNAVKILVKDRTLTHTIETDNLSRSSEQQVSKSNKHLRWSKVSTLDFFGQDYDWHNDANKPNDITYNITRSLGDAMNDNDFLYLWYEGTEEAAFKMMSIARQIPGNNKKNVENLEWSHGCKFTSLFIPSWCP